MGEKARVKETVRLYSKVWQLPTHRGIVLRIAIIVVGFSLIMSLLQLIANTTLDPTLTLLQYMVLLVSPSIIGTPLLYLIIRQENSPLDTRRTSAVVQFAILVWFVFGLLGTVLDIVFPGLTLALKLWLVGAGMGYMLGLFLVTGLSDHHPVRNMSAAVMLPLSWTTVSLLLQQIGSATPSLTGPWYVILPGVILFCTLAVNFIFNAVSVPFERDLGISGPALLRAFGHDYLADNPTPFETLISKIAEKQDVPIEVIVFRSPAEELVAVGVVLYVHPGPFRDLGSSDLPSRIIEYVNDRYSIPSFIMHGTCTHHQNLTTKEDYDLVFKELDKVIQETTVQNQVIGPHFEGEGKFKVWSLLAGSNALVITTSAPEFTDDIALEVGIEAAEESREHVAGIRHIAMVDGHNCIDDEAISIMPGDDDATTYVSDVKRALASTIGQAEHRLSIGIHQVIEKDFPTREGLGPGGVTALVFRSERGDTAYISVDGNNMEPGMREEVQQLLSAEGFMAAEVITTDTHVVNAISLSSKGYPPVGRYRKQQVLDMVTTAAINARDKIQPVSVGLGFGEIKGLRTFGERGFDVLTQDIVEAADIAKRTGLRTLAVTFLLTVLFSLFI